ncbi:MAG: hypothetical protein DSM106950_23940 [Stigonema ocellatum SAG 48.90 = DSM 106950]|nr:hypothetical protein [Stigonema ocellatum SAG 48.90 = DSM 106950]
MTQIISDFSFPCIEQGFANSQQVSFEWIQSLPPEQKDAALFRFCKTIEARPTLVESFSLSQVLYRTISGNTFTESADSVAERTGCDRKTILKGLSIAVEQNILEKNERPGTSTEYSFKRVEEWLPEPVVRIKDIRTRKIIEFPSSHNNDSVEDGQQLTSDHEVVLTTDYSETEPQLTSNLEVVRLADSNKNTVVVSLKELEEQQQLDVRVPATDTPKSPWKYVGQGLPRVYVAPELDALTGSKIESIHEATSRPRQGIIKEAVDLLYNQMNRIPSFLEEKPKPKFNSVGSVIPSAVCSGIPELVFIALQNAGIDLGLSTAERLWVKYSDKFSEAIAYTITQDVAGKIKQSKEGFFRRSLSEGWNLTIKPQVRDTEVEPAKGIDEPSAEEMALIDDAIANGRARNKYYGTYGWLVIRSSGHSESWRDFLYK